MSGNKQFGYGNRSAVPEEDNHQPSSKLSTTVSSRKSAQPCESKCLQLRFLNSNPMPDVVYSGKPLGEEVDASIEVALVDGLTGNVVKSGCEASAEVEILVLKKAFNKNDMDNWTAEEYGPYILPGRDGKPSLLAKPRVNLSEGRGSLGHVKFSHSRTYLPVIEVRLGARVVGLQGDSSDGSRVREAISEAFTVKDRRGMPKKDNQLSTHDSVSRLKNIGNNGPFHEKLRAEGIVTVKDFLTKGRQSLQDILGERMTAKKLKETIEHAKQCQKDLPNDSPFPQTSEQNAGLVSNVQEEMDIFPTANHDAPEMVSDTLKAEASHMVAAPCKDSGEVIIFYDDSSNSSDLLIKSMYTKDAFNHPFDIPVRGDINGPFAEEEHSWHLTDTETIRRALGGNKHQQFSIPINPFQSSTFCSPADLHKVLHGLLVGDVSVDKAQTRRGWKLLFSILRWWFSIRRTVARKRPFRGRKRCRQEEMF